MSDSVFIGQRAASMETSPQFEQVTKVVLLVDDTNYFEAGTDGGRTIEVTCPYATQQMANNILAALSGYQYQPMQATDALMDPAAELGDGVTVGGVYTVLASVSTQFDELMTADIGAPGQEEIESEYPYLSKQTSQINRQIAQTQSLISKTAEEITLEIQGLSGEVSSLSVTLDGVTISGPSGETLIKGSSIDTSTIKANSISADALNLTGEISFADLDTGTQEVISNASSNASNANNKVTAWTYPGSTQINGSMIQTGTVRASILAGGTVQLLAADESISGYITMTPASSANFAVEFASQGALRMFSAAGSSAFFGAGGSSGGQGFVQCGADGTGTPGVSVGGSYIGPAGSGNVSCGNANHLWSSVYALNGTIQTSDENKKNSIQDLPQKYADMLLSLSPKRFKMNDGTSERYHVGYSAQDVKAGMDSYDIDSQEFGGFVIGNMGTPDEIWMLRYEEFLPIHTMILKQLMERVERLEAAV